MTPLQICHTPVVVIGEIDGGYSRPLVGRLVATSQGRVFKTLNLVIFFDNYI